VITSTRTYVNVVVVVVIDVNGDVELDGEL
jgi:hypothetical protein